ncbi:nose resistant to fluoxetine protein 6-like [Haemaphysalis longicornis]
MPGISNMFVYIVVALLYINLDATTSAKKQPMRPLYYHALKERPASAFKDLSQPCLADFNLYLHQLEEGTEWALKMFDSSAKPESGVLKGSHTFLGFYSECIDALPASTPTQNKNNNSAPEPNFSSTYCLATLRLAPEHHVFEKVQLRPLCDHFGGVDLTFAVCLPSTCSEDDAGKISVLSLRESGCSANVTSAVCRKTIKPLRKDIAAIMVAVFLAIVAAVVVGATLFDCKRRKSVSMGETAPAPVHVPHVENSVPRIGPPELKPMNFAKKALLCFSLLQNAKKVFGSDSRESGSIRVLHGMRFFSLAWVICVHNPTTAKALGLFRNVDDVYRMDFKKKLANRAPLAIDTFFFIGGLVLAYSTLRQLHKTGGQMNWLLCYIRRYLRTVPVVMVVVAIGAFLMRHFGDGPRWGDFLATFETNCRISWWTYPLYVQNFALLDKQCLAHTWYSAADFQIYLISPPILYSLYKKPRLGAVMTISLAMASTILSAAYSSVMSVRFSDRDFDYYRDVYNKPYFRCSPYLLGMLMGFFLSKGQKTMRPPRTRYVNLGWILCAFALLFCIYGYWICDPVAPTFWNGTFSAIASSLWAAGIAWIVYACIAGCGGIFTCVLASHALESLSKLTFSTYVIHEFVLLVFFANLEDSIYYSSFLMSYFFAGHLLLSYAVSIVLCMIIELPISGLERLILGSK